MCILDASVRKIWDALRARKQVQADFLDEVRLKALRGIGNLPVAFDYAVSVIAGPNGCGKSTVLFACAAAYAPRGRSARAYTPAALFPGFSGGGGGAGGFVDDGGGTALEFCYLVGGDRYSMVWKRGRSWSRSFMGRKDVRQPERVLYLRTLANLTNPSEVRWLLQLGRGAFEAEDITPDLPLFARRVLPQKYRGVSLIRGRNRDLLFAGLDRHDAVRYSEFRMSAGERAILRMSRDISCLKRALIRIDEIEAGFHRWTQQQLMVELQRIALRNDLRVLVTTHSPVVLDSVPPEGRIFLERDAVTLDVTRRPAWRDIFQKALYGQSADWLSILCEDEVAEGVILGVLDVLNYRNGTRRDGFVIGRDYRQRGVPGARSRVRQVREAGRLRLRARRRRRGQGARPGRGGEPVRPQARTPVTAGPGRAGSVDTERRPGSAGRVRAGVRTDRAGPARTTGVHRTDVRWRRDHPPAARAEGDGAGAGRQVDAGRARDRADRRQTGNRGGPWGDGRVQRRAHGADRRVAAGRRPMMAGCPPHSLTAWPPSVASGRRRATVEEESGVSEHMTSMKIGSFARGKSTPWFWSCSGAGLLAERTDGSRWNGYTNAVKRAARARKAVEAGRREGDAR